MITIKDVAARAGVSPSTVSRVITGSSRISIETKEKVREAMKELGYHPNAIARSLVNKSTMTIGIIMPRSAEEVFLNPFFPEALRGIAKSVHDMNYCILITTGNSDEEQIESLRSLIHGGRVDGLILMYSKYDDPVLKELKEHDLPFSIIGRPTDEAGVDYVDNDNINAAYEGTMFLLENGHRRIGIINGSMSLTVSVDRYEGFKRAMKEFGLIIDPDLIKSSEFVQEGGYECMQEILSYPEMPTAVLVTDDIMAFGAMRAAREKGISVPDDISIMSFNNIPLAEFASPPLTSIDIDAYSLGYQAAELVFEKIEGRQEAKKLKIPTRVIVRNSVKNI